MTCLEHLYTVCADGHHNAFTALTRFGDQYWLAHRQANGHGTEPVGKIVLYTSQTGEAWEEFVCFGSGGDDRDPKFFAAQGALHVHWGTYITAVTPWYTVQGQHSNPRYLVSHMNQLRSDTASLGHPLAFTRPNYWTWSIVDVSDFDSIQQEQTCWLAAAYHFGDGGDAESIVLFASTGMTQYSTYSRRPPWRWYGQILGNMGEHYTEPVLWREGTALRCLVRDEHGPALLGTAEGLEEWTWQSLNLVLHSAAVLYTGDVTYVAGRARYDQLPAEGRAVFPPRKSARQDTVWRTALFILEGDKRLRHLFTLPSWGDNGYPGLEMGPDGSTLLLSYYSQHEHRGDKSAWETLMQPDAANVYCAEIAV